MSVLEQRVERLEREQRVEGVERAEGLSKREELARLISSLPAKGVTKIDQLRQRTGYNPVKLITCCAEYNIKLPDFLFSTKRNESRDRLIAQGASLVEIEKKEGISRQAVSNYIVYTGQYFAWREKREEIRKAGSESRRYQTQLKADRKRIVDLLYQQMLSAALQGSSAERKAVEYLLKAKSKVYSFEELAAFFEAYERIAQAATASQLQSSPYLSKQTGLHYRSLLHILRTVGLRNDTPQQHPRRKTPVALEPAIERAIALDLSENDIGYFLGIIGQSIIYRRAKNNIRTKKKPYIVKKRQLNYRTASIICEMLDCGAKANYINESYGITMRRIECVKRHRKEIDAKLIRVLQIIYDNPSLDKPYKINLVRQS